MDGKAADSPPLDGLTVRLSPFDRLTPLTLHCPAVRDQSEEVKTEQGRRAHRPDPAVAGRTDGPDPSLSQGQSEEVKAEQGRRAPSPGYVLFPRVGFIVTNLETDSRAVVRFYNKRGTAEVAAASFGSPCASESAAFT